MVYTSFPVDVKRDVGLDVLGPSEDPGCKGGTTQSGDVRLHWRTSSCCSCLKLASP